MDVEVQKDNRSLTTISFITHCLLFIKIASIETVTPQHGVGPLVTLRVREMA